MRLISLAVALMAPPAAAVGCGPLGDNGAPLSEAVETDDIQRIRPDIGFVGVRDLTLHEGSVWVLDAAPPFLTRISFADGSIVQTGRKGQGPGEYRAPWAVQPALEGFRGDGVRVWDLGNARVSRIGRDGAFLESGPFDRDNGLKARGNIRDLSYVDPFRIRNLEGRIVSGHFPQRVNGTLDILGGTLQIADHHLRPAGEIFRFMDGVDLRHSSSPVWASVPLWDACGGVVAVWNPAFSGVQWFDSGGLLIGQDHVQVHPRTVGPAAVLSYIRWRVRVESGAGSPIPESYIQRLEQRFRPVFAKEAPPVTDIRCQAPGTAWLRLFDTSQDPVGRSQTWERVSDNNDHRRITFPPGFTPLVFSGQGAVGLMTGPDGLEHLARWPDPISTPKPPLQPQ